MKFLVIEVYTDIASYLRQYFAKAGYRFDFGHTGSIELHLGAGFPGDLIVADWPARPRTRIHRHDYRIGGKHL